MMLSHCRGLVMMQAHDVLEVINQLENVDVSVWHDGDGIQQLQDGRLFHYPSHGFTGTGQIENQTVRCLTAEVQVLCHLGYEPDENDYHDMFLLEKHFKIRLPAPYSSVQ